VLPVVVTVNVEAPEPVKVAGEKPTVVPVGWPLAVSVTTPVNPPSAATVAVYVAGFPTITVCELGLPVIEKSGEVTTCGTICMPFTGARGYASVDAPGVAVMVKPVALTVNFT
jgi:hypothetical protein